MGRKPEARSFRGHGLRLPKGRGKGSRVFRRIHPRRIIAKLREAEVDLNQGATIEAVCRKLEISEASRRFIAGGISTAE